MPKSRLFLLALADTIRQFAKVNGLEVPIVKPGKMTQKGIELEKSGPPIPSPTVSVAFPNPVRAGGISIKFVTEVKKKTD